MNLYSVFCILLFLGACSSSSDAPDTKRNLLNPILTEYSDKNNLSDYAFFKSSIQEFSARSFERARRWALLKEGPHVLSFVSSDIIEGSQPLASPLGPDPTLIDWMPWWMDLLKIEVSTLLLSKESDLKLVSPVSCLKIYQQRLIEGLNASPPLLETQEAQVFLSQLKLKEQWVPENLWKLSAPTESTEEQIYAWQRAVGMEPKKNQKVREFYFSRNGVRRRILSVHDNDQISFAVEVPQDPYRSAEYFSKSNQKNLCQRLNLGLSFSKLQTEAFVCSDLEGPQVARLDSKLLFALTKIAEVPELPLAGLYKLRCQELADFHRQQWNSMDTLNLVKRLKLYPQLEKRLRYFATMESKALLSIAAKYRSKNN